MLDHDIAYCGLKCSECPVRIATMEGDEEKRAQLAKDYSCEACVLTLEDIDCHGCKSDHVSQKMCGACEIKACAVERGVANCGHCEDYPCDLTLQYVPKGSDNRKTLDYIHLEHKTC